MNIEIESKYLNGESCKDGDLVEFLDEGVESKLPGKYNFNVDSNGKKMIYTPNNSALKKFIVCWGKNSEEWIGKQFKVQLVTIMVKGEPKKSILPIIQANLVESYDTI